jgi:hypothetical protein
MDSAEPVFETFFGSHENSISGLTKNRRQREFKRVQLGIRYAASTWKDYLERGENSKLEELQRTCNLHWIGFLGTPLLDATGRRCYINFSHDGKEWHVGTFWELDNFSGDTWRIAGLYRPSLLHRFWLLCQGLAHGHVPGIG